MARLKKHRVISATNRKPDATSSSKMIPQGIPPSLPGVPIENHLNSAPPTVETATPLYGASQRWTEDLVKGGFTPVSDYFLKNYSVLVPPISTGEALFIIHLVSFKWTRKAPRPSMRRIAERMAVSEVSVRGYARSLEVKKYLERVMRVGRTNQFRLRPLFNALEAHMQANATPPDNSDEIDD